MTTIPHSALALGLLGLVPFVWGALTSVVPALRPEAGTFFGIHSGPDVMVNAGRIILSFMSGVLWGFAARAKGLDQALGYVLGAAPAIFVFLFVIAGDPRANLAVLIIGFLALLMLDRYFLMQQMAPDWWMRLRVPLTGLVCALLAVGLFAR